MMVGSNYFHWFVGSLAATERDSGRTSMSFVEHQRLFNGSNNNHISLVFLLRRLLLLLLEATK